MIPKPRFQYIPRPKPERLPERKAVTVIAGFVCCDGIVVAADTEHNSSVAKFQRKKIIYYEDADCAVRFAYAGHTDYTDMAIDKMRRAISTSDKTLPGMQAACEEVLLNVYGSHISPFFDMNDQNRPQILLLIAVRVTSGEMQLFRVVDTTVSPVAYFDALGTGEYLARSMADWLYDLIYPFA